MVGKHCYRLYFNIVKVYNNNDNNNGVSNVVMIQGFGTNCQGELWLHPNVFSIYFLCGIFHKI